VLAHAHERRRVLSQNQPAAGPQATRAPQPV